MTPTRTTGGGVVVLLLAAAMTATARAGDGLGHYGEWEVFTRESGLPSERVNCLCVTDEGLWIGTACGVARYAGGVLEKHPTAGRLANAFVTSIAFHEPTGDVWVGTLTGLTRYSAGRRIDYNQVNSGLINDVIYGVAASRTAIWVATAAGCGRYDLARDEWTLFDRSNSPMPEVTLNGVSATEDRVAVAVFGGGVLEYRNSTGRWRRFLDPDGDRVTDLLSDDGLIHDVVNVAVHDESGRLWAGTRFGLSCFDGGRWRSFRSFDSPLACERVTSLIARGRFVWIGTDEGLYTTDGTRWIVYRRWPAERDRASTPGPEDSLAQHIALPASFPEGPINDIAFDGSDIWVATDSGLAHGRTIWALDLTETPAVVSSQRSPSTRADRLTPIQAIPLRRYSDPYGRFYECLPPTAKRPHVISPPVVRERVKLGFLSPAGGARDAHLAREMLDGIRLALEEVNEAGGYKGVPFELVVRGERGLWGATAANEIVSLALEDGVVALFGPVDGASAQAAAQLAGRLRLPVVNTAATDPGLTELGDPWLVRNMPDDRQQAYALAHHVYNECVIELVAGMRSDDRFGYLGLAAFREASDRLGHPLRLSLRWVAGQESFAEAINQIAVSAVGGLVLWGPADDAAKIVRQVRARGLPVRIFGCDRLASEAFLRSAGKAAEGVTAVATYDPGSTDTLAASFREAFSRRWAYQPGTFAVHAYDGARMLLDCIRRAGPQAALIRDELAGQTDYRGAAGAVTFDTTLNAVGGLYVAQVTGGMFTCRAVDLVVMPANNAVRVLDRELARYAFAPPREPGLHSRRQDYNVGCFWPLDGWGRRALLGAELAVSEDAVLHPAAPPISLHAHDARADWGTQCAALVDLVREDEVLAILGPSDGPIGSLLPALAARISVPIVALGQGTVPSSGGDSARWFSAPPPGGLPHEAAGLLEKTLGRPTASDQALGAGYAAARFVIRAIRGGATSRAGLAESLRSTGRYGTPKGAGRSTGGRDEHERTQQ